MAAALAAVAVAAAAAVAMEHLYWCASDVAAAAAGVAVAFVVDDACENAEHEIAVVRAVAPVHGFADACAHGRVARTVFAQPETLL